MKTKTMLSVAVALLVASCGGAGANGQGAEAEGEHHGGGEGHMEGEHHGEGGEGREHAELPAGLGAFHEAFAPIWHSDAGEERTRQACEATPQLSTLATGAEQDAAEGNQPTLATAVGALRTACDGGDAAATDEALQGVHDAFHAIIEGLE